MSGKHNLKATLELDARRMSNRKRPKVNYSSVLKLKHLCYLAIGPLFVGPNFVVKYL